MLCKSVGEWGTLDWRKKTAGWAAFFSCEIDEIHDTKGKNGAAGFLKGMEKGA